MTNTADLLKENKRLKTDIARLEHTLERQINPPLAIQNVDYREKYEAAHALLQDYKPIRFTNGMLFRKVYR